MCISVLTILHRYLYTKVGKFQKSITKKITCLISFNCTVFITDTYRLSQLNFLGNWMHFKIAEYFSRLARKGYDCVPRSFQDNGGVQTSDFLGNVHMLFLFIL